MSFCLPPWSPHRQGVRHIARGRFVPVTGAEPGPRAAYDAVARAYDREIGDELNRKPLDRALLDCIASTAAGGRLADVGCGPGHVTRYLAERHPDVIGLDLSPEMIAVARERAPAVPFEIGSMLALPADDCVWAGLVALYSIIHFDSTQRVVALREFARVLRPGGWALVAFHVESSEYQTGQARHITEWFGSAVDVHTFFLDPADVTKDMSAAGLAVLSTVLRDPWPAADEYPSRRCYLLAHRT
jgi:ubiquinone/menaquinone biosynthesis C-methylase UbiE